jgi:hypothetical protein
MAGGGPIETWKVDGVLKYLGKHFPGARFDDYPRGTLAHLFVVIDGGGLDPTRRKRHNLFVTRQFFDRAPDATTLQDALEAADVAKALGRAGERSVDLY